MFERESAHRLLYKAVFGLRELIPLVAPVGNAPPMGGFPAFAQYAHTTKCRYFVKFGSLYFKGYRLLGFHLSRKITKHSIFHVKLQCIPLKYPLYPWISLRYPTKAVQSKTRQFLNILGDESPHHIQINLICNTETSLT